ncbi:hypothetical protein AB0L64_37795 [Kribbella sp. NPDC051936]|uniref:hypothetical protein n=1 Tax=Kribbella sp. NPDC051936 TaxID=3154946 RepID=UPI003437212B
MTLRHPGGRVRQVGLGVVGDEIADCVVAGKPFVQQPLDGSALGSHVTKGVPDRHQLGVFLVQLVLESAEGSLAEDCPLQPSSDTLVAERLGQPTPQSRCGFTPM